jgi:RNA recognition motif-containing protein
MATEEKSSTLTSRTTMMESEQSSDSTQISGGEKRSLADVEKEQDTFVEAPEGSAEIDSDGNKKRRVEEGGLPMVHKTASPPPSSSAVVRKRPAMGLVSEVCTTGSLFVGGLHPRVADVHLQKLFQPYGTVQRIFQCRHPGNDQPKGFGFVEYESMESAQLALERLNGRVLLGRTLRVRPAKAKSEASSSSSGQGGILTTAIPTDLRSVQKQTSNIESRIEAVKRAIREKNAKK